MNPELEQVIQDLHALIAHDPNPAHKPIYAQCLQALLRLQQAMHAQTAGLGAGGPGPGPAQAGPPQAGSAGTEDPRAALIAALGG